MLACCHTYKNTHAVLINSMSIILFNFFFSILVQEVQEEGRHAIDDPGAPNAPEIPPEDYILRKWL